MSVVGKSTGAASAAVKVEAVQPVALYDASTGLPSAGGGGSTTVSGVNGTTAATAANPLPVGIILTAGTNRSGTATTTSGGLTVPANTSRRFLVGQNISAVVIGFNEFGGTAAIGTAGTYTVPAGASFSISTTDVVNFIAASGTAAVTMSEG